MITPSMNGPTFLSHAPSGAQTAPLVELRNVQFSYSVGGRAILDDFSLTVPRGKVTAIMGASGGGKTTVLRLVGGQQKATQGQVLFDGLDMGTASQEQIYAARRRMGMLFQFGALFTDMSVFDNVALPMIIDGFTPAEVHKRVSAALDKVGLHDKAGYLPMMLSGGEQQRVGIARAIVNTPPLLLADEPTGNLDAQLAADIMQLFTEFNDVGVTVLIASHDQGLIRQSGRRTLTLQTGRLVADSAHGGIDEA